MNKEELDARAGRSAVRIRARITEFAYPAVHDGVVIGKNAPLGLESFRRALSLLVASTFEHIHVEDAVVGDILVRTAVLRRIDSARLLAFVLRQVKPLDERRGASSTSISRPRYELEDDGS